MDPLRTSAAVLWFGTAALALASLRLGRRHRVAAVLAALASIVMGLWHAGVMARFIIWAVGRAMPADQATGLISAALLCGSLVALLIQVGPRGEGFDLDRPAASPQRMPRAQSEPHTRAPVRDLHQRVESNLAIALRLLSVTAQQADESGQAALARCRGRIAALSAAHGALASEMDPAAVEFEPLVRRLAPPVYEMVNVTEDRVRLVVDSSPAVPAALAVPCALMLHELLANSLAHAFGDDRHGQIRAGWSGTNEEGWLLTVRDNGVGLGAQPETARRGGLALLDSLAEAVGGQVHTDDDRGWVCTIVLPGQTAPHDAGPGEPDDG